MPSVTRNTSVSIGGLSFPSVTTRTGTGVIASEVTVSGATLTAAKSGTLSTRTDDDTGTVTASAGGHGITDGDIVDIYWTGGVAYGATVGTVSGTSIPFDTSLGDVLPAQATAVTICKQTVLDLDFDGDSLEMLQVYSNVRGHVQFTEDDNTSLAARELTANEALEFIDDTEDATFITGDPVGKVKVSIADTGTSGYIRLGALYNA